jgi:peptidoglycan DL-endopeptidase CwlO
LSVAACTVVTTLVLAGGGAVAHAAPSATVANAATFEGAKTALATIDAELGHLEEQYAQALLAKGAAEQRSATLKLDLAAQQTKVETLRAQAAAFARASFQTAGVDTATRLFTSGDPDSFLQQVSTAAKVDENINQVLQQFQAEQANQDDLTRASDAEIANASAAIKQMDDLRSQAKAKAAEQQGILDRLTADQQAAVGESAGGVATTTVEAAAASPAAVQEAVAYVLNHVGDAYVWGAEGPSAFDCSGLMVAAYRSAGISIQHSALGLSGTGRSVAKADLQPGDLVFWYSPVHHVGMYVGNGMMVHARNVRVGVVEQSVDSYIAAGAPYSGAVRIVG